MKAELIKKEGNKVTLKITVDNNKFEEAVTKAYNKTKGKYNIPGFRKGKAPKVIIETQYGKGVFYNDAIEMLFPEVYPTALDELNIEPIDRPDLDVEEISKDNGLVMVVNVEVKPEFELGNYKGIEIAKADYNVSEEDVESTLKDMVNKNARLVSVEDRAIENGDTAVIDFEGFESGVAFEGGKGENYPLTIGSGSFIPGFEEQLIGAEPEKEVEVKVTFPEDYHAEDLKGKEAVFKCTVHEIKAKELPELDDEFASEVSEFDTLDELKADIKAKIKEQKVNDGKRAQEDAAVDAIIESAKMDLPEAMVDTQARQMLDEFAQRMQQQGLTLDQYMQFTGMTADKMMDELRPQAEKRIKTRLVLEAIAKAENIEITDEKLDEEIAKMAEAYQMEADKLKSFMGDKEKEQMKQDMAVQEAITFVVDNAVEK